jgi:hypothetical protein
LDLFGGIGTLQWVTAKKIKKISVRLLGCMQPGFSAAARHSTNARSAPIAIVSTNSEFLQEIVHVRQWRRSSADRQAKGYSFIH